MGESPSKRFSKAEKFYLGRQIKFSEMANRKGRQNITKSGDVIMCFLPEMDVSKSKTYFHKNGQMQVLRWLNRKKNV